MKSIKKKVVPKSTKIIEEAKNKIGSPIKQGAIGPFEFCNSGFSHYCLYSAGIKIPESLKEQSEGGKEVDTPSEGDLLFFDKIGKGVIADVGICIGEGKMIIAPENGKCVKEAEYVNNTYWKNKFKFAKRYW